MELPEQAWNSTVISHVMQLVGCYETGIKKMREMCLGIQRMLSCQADQVRGSWEPVVRGELVLFIDRDLRPVLVLW